MNRHALHWVLVGGWVLIMPPVPLGTSLPPLSQWSKVSAHKTAGECESARDAFRDKAKHTVTADPNAHATVVAAALGQLQSKCVETKTAAAEPPETPEPAPRPDGAPDPGKSAQKDDAPKTDGAPKP